MLPIALALALLLVAASPADATKALAKRGLVVRVVERPPLAVIDVTTKFSRLPIEKQAAIVGVLCKIYAVASVERDEDEQIGACDVTLGDTKIGQVALEQPMSETSATETTWTPAYLVTRK